MSDPFDLSDGEPLPAQAGPAGRQSQIPADAPWLSGLNPEQRQAVETTEGPVLVLSGAGTGKTRVLTSRLAHILMSGKARPWNLLAVTFTNKAAREMRERVATLVGPVAEQVWLGTFHALGVRMLRRHGKLVGLESNFTILDTDDQLRLLKQVMEAERVDWKRWPAQALMGTIQRWKDKGLSPEQVDAGEAGDFAGGRAQQLYKAYQDRLRALNACDFGDLLLHCLTIFRDPQHRGVLTDYQQQFRYILVDEYQDTNIAQYLWLRLLAQAHKNICCVGDDDQSIYSWRGAEVGNILKFDQDFPGSTVVRLESNYRSTPAILAAASGLIGHNEGRLGKTLRPGDSRAQDGEPIVVRGLWDGEEEARWVVEEIEARQRAGTSLDEIAILVRAGFQTREFEERLITTGIPYKVVGGLRFYERQEIRDALAYFRVVAQPADDLAFERIVNLPKRGLGEATMQAMHVLARTQNISLVSAARQLVESDELKPKARATLGTLLDDFDRWRGLVADMPHGELAQTILDESGYTGMWRTEKTPDAQGRLENLKELTSAMEEFETMAGFLEHVSLVMENDEKTDVERVNVMTLHGAKGLEFDVVFLPGWEEGVFPHQRALEESGTRGLEEERRLAYVGLTRARRRVFVSYAANRRIYNQWQNNLPSRFVEELPVENIERQADKGLFDGGGEQASAWGNSWNGGYVTQRRREKQIDDAVADYKGQTPEDGYATGDRVFHQKFGYGRVQSVDGNKLEIAFDTAGVKKVIDSFISPA
ncbi:UvrD-helicase domain-containing protein [Telmatospirillum sp.]|uniref:ATP-dependent helicase n=1 Tax=Telmatospirillum sp. TaxID=2079197 RepID=UPI002850B4F0|nr:UvrD-helicase domain-containing protein [Telmatospirillum sp.]MDR3435809.1 UvrD-helicase domain-containing protein [Telmatospirillum sp.]